MSSRNTQTAAQPGGETRRPFVKKTKSASRPEKSGYQIRKYYLQSIARELMPGSRVSKCMRVHIPKSEAVNVWHSPSKKRAYYTGLIRCKRVWVCPVCAVSITERRQNELRDKLSATETVWAPTGDQVERTITIPRWRLGMATFTIRHREGVSLQDVLSTLEAAYKRCWGGRWAVGWRSYFGVVGTVRAIEVTHGKNGWHPHIHTLVVRGSASSAQIAVEMEHTLRARWLACVPLAGGMVDEIHGCHYEASDERIIEYVAKIGVSSFGGVSEWDAIREVAKYPVKTGRDGGRGLWELLDGYARGDVRSGMLWIEAQSALRGHRHMVASRGLYEKIRATESAKTDDVLGDDTQEIDDILLASLTLDDWRSVVRKDKRGELLEIASRGDHGLLSDYLEGIL